MPSLPDDETELIMCDLDEHAATLRALSQRLETAAPDAAYTTRTIAHELWEIHKALGDGRCSAAEKRAAASGLSKSRTVTMYQTLAGTRYVRIRELPEALQDDFMRYMRGAAMPIVDDKEGPVAFEVDWLDWLHDRRPDRAVGHDTISGQGDDPHDNSC